MTPNVRTAVPPVLARRTELGLTRRQVQDRSGVSTSTIERVEKPGASRPNIPTMRALATALNCTVADLFGEDAH